jgi:hypothetical protein
VVRPHPGERRGGELAALIGVEDLWPAVPSQRIVNRIQAEIDLQGDRHPPGVVSRLIKARAIPSRSIRARAALKTPSRAAVPIAGVSLFADAVHATKARTTAIPAMMCAHCRR